MIEIGMKLFVLMSILVLAVLQSIAWYLGFDGQLTLAFSGAIIALVSLVTGININIKK